MKGQWQKGLVLNGAALAQLNGEGHLRVLALAIGNIRGKMEARTDRSGWENQ